MRRRFICCNQILKVRKVGGCKGCKRERSKKEDEIWVSLRPKNREMTLLDLIYPKTFMLGSLPVSCEQLELKIR